MMDSAIAPVLLWFRDDLRLDDNPALYAAAAGSRPLITLYIIEEGQGPRPLGAAARWWLHHSLTALRRALHAHGVPLLLMRGKALSIIPELVQKFGIGEVHWNRRYEKAAIDIDAALKKKLIAQNIGVESHNGHLLVEPWTLSPQTGSFFKVFTPFWRAALAKLEILSPSLPVPPLHGARIEPQGETLDDLALLPKSPDWSDGLRESWIPGEAGAWARLDAFLANALDRYAMDRDLPAADASSRLSPHLRFGEISVRRIWHRVIEHALKTGCVPVSVKKFQSELGWREFSYHLLFHFPELSSQNFNSRFAHFPWRSTDEAKAEIKAWRRGRTGYPLVDAGMRELWQTGWMHNRARMVAASFLVKHLLVDWRVGERWFWDTLCDADPANNPASWQWIAGSGADAAPYFRIFNPLLQAEKFDEGGVYVHRFVPELTRASVHLPDPPHHSSSSPYPKPLIAHEMARARALKALINLPT